MIFLQPLVQLVVGLTKWARLASNRVSNAFCCSFEKIIQGQDRGGTPSEKLRSRQCDSKMRRTNCRGVFRQPSWLVVCETQVLAVSVCLNDIYSNWECLWKAVKSQRSKSCWTIGCESRLRSVTSAASCLFTWMTPTDHNSILPLSISVLFGAHDDWISGNLDDSSDTSFPGWLPPTTNPSPLSPSPSYLAHTYLDDSSATYLPGWLPQTTNPSPLSPSSPYWCTRWLDIYVDFH